MFKLVRLQAYAALIGVFIAALVFGLRGATWAAIGGATCVLPSLLFAWFLTYTTGRRGSAQVTAFFVGEAVKTVLSIGFLVAVGLLIPGAHWGALVMGLIITLQANFFAFLVKL
ncbi:ATP synthase subunit I [Uliginosibacterium flavum]|uniref:ATP synthase subunit I n=1 Tax=Uliginosibacterium flavum TaxID=1396831 RepID=A0ABV2TMY0_9RHOO